MADDKKNVASFLTDLAIHTSTVIQQQLKVDTKRANEIGRALADHIRQAYGGANLYIPKGASLDAMMRNHAIYADFRGNNHTELAFKYGVTEQHVYNVIRTITETIRKSQQGSLFDED